jgi:hypothetical protein
MAMGVDDFAGCRPGGRYFSSFSSILSARQRALRANPAAPIPAFFKKDLRDEVSTVQLLRHPISLAPMGRKRQPRLLKL